MFSTDLAAYFGLLHRYYSHALTRVDASEWSAFEIFAESKMAQENPQLRAAALRIAQAPEADITSFEHQFNRLFVGPEELLAAPYETVYLAGERVLMREATMAVRRAYEDAGMQVGARNVEPDDHFAYECAFMAHLAEQGDEKAVQAFETFAIAHLARWVAPHVAAIRKNTTNEVCLGFADLLESLNIIIQTQPKPTFTQ